MTKSVRVLATGVSTIFAAVSWLGCAASAPLKHPFAWEVRKGDHVSMLYGSIHRGVDVERIPEPIRDRFKKAKGLVVETDVVDPTSIAKFRDWSQKRNTLLWHSKDYHLEQVLTPEGYSAARAAWLADAKTKKTPQEQERARARFQTASPWAAAVIYRRSLGDESITLDRYDYNKISRAKPIDHALIEEAKAQSMPIDTLDEYDPAKPEFGHGSFDCYQRQALYMIESGVRERVGEKAAFLVNEVENYESGNDQFFTTLPPGLDCDVLARNQFWVQKLARLLEENQNLFVVVGLAHMTFAQGNLISMLKEKGFTVERVQLGDGAH